MSCRVRRAILISAQNASPLLGQVARVQLSLTFPEYPMLFLTCQVDENFSITSLCLRILIVVFPMKSRIVFRNWLVLWTRTNLRELSWVCCVFCKAGCDETFCLHWNFGPFWVIRPV
ncbi:uncharacterized protein LOC143428054 [Xylocopa sonorina]|uniref:uncharacterized protein LOC143428054 n=1 Tax=Xylocopa sonorina TaxID=1818115 RepID=UPI00403AA0EC